MLAGKLQPVADSTESSAPPVIEGEILPITTITAVADFSESIYLPRAYLLMNLDQIENRYGDWRRSTGEPMQTDCREPVFKNNISLQIPATLLDRRSDRPAKIKVFNNKIQLIGMHSTEEIVKVGKFVTELILQTTEILALLWNDETPYWEIVDQKSVSPENFLLPFLHEYGMDMFRRLFEPILAEIALLRGKFFSAGQEMLHWLLYTRTINHLRHRSPLDPEPELLYVNRIEQSMVNHNVSLNHPVNQYRLYKEIIKNPHYRAKYEPTVNENINIQRILAATGRKQKPLSVSLLVFSSGSVVISGPDALMNTRVYNEFAAICRQIFAQDLPKTPLMDDQELKSRFPVRDTTLYKVDSRGKIRFWKISLDWENCCLITETGLVDGKISKSRYPVILNQSNRNEYDQMSTNFYTRLRDKLKLDFREEYPSHRDAQGKLVQQLGYHNRIQLLGEFKAAVITEWPVFCQAKIDGFRAISFRKNGELKMISRKSTEFSHLDHLRTRISQLLEELAPYGVDALDGELYIHGMSFQKLSSCIRKVKTVHPENRRISYRIFDFIPTAGGELAQKPYLERYQLLAKFLPLGGDQGEIPDPGEVTLLPAYTANSLEDIDLQHSVFLAGGYEGSVVRKNLPHRVGRSEDALKYKNFDDAEGTIVEVEDGVGKDAGLAIFKLQSDSGAIFSCRPRASDDDRREWFLRKNELVGKRYTYRFMGFSQDNVPRHPIGVGFFSS